MNMRTCFWLPLALSLLYTSAGYAASDGEGNKQEKAPHDSAWVKEKAKACAACHGPTGVSQTENFPIIAGQYQDYLVHSMKGYRDGKRNNAIMATQMKGFTDAQIKALARFYARQSSPLHVITLDEDE